MTGMWQLTAACFCIDIAAGVRGECLLATALRATTSS